MLAEKRKLHSGVHLLLHFFDLCFAETLRITQEIQQGFSTFIITHV